MIAANCAISFQLLLIVVRRSRPQARSRSRWQATSQIEGGLPRARPIAWRASAGLRSTPAQRLDGSDANHQCGRRLDGRNQVASDDADARFHAVRHNPRGLAEAFAGRRRYFFKAVMLIAPTTCRMPGALTCPSSCRRCEASANLQATEKFLGRPYRPYHPTSSPCRDASTRCRGRLAVTLRPEWRRPGHPCACASFHPSHACADASSRASRACASPSSPASHGFLDASALERWLRGWLEPQVTARPSRLPFDLRHRPSCPRPPLRRGVDDCERPLDGCQGRRW